MDRLDNDAASAVVVQAAQAHLPSRGTLAQVNSRWRHVAEQTNAQVTDIRIEHYLKAAGPGVKALADTCERFSNLARLHAHGCTVDLAAIKEHHPPPSLAQVRSLVTGPASASAHGLVLAVYALAQLLADNDATLTVPDSAFHGDKTITSIEVPNGYTAMGSRAFARCTALASVDLPAGLTSIGHFAFARTSLASVEFPAGLTRIGVSAFAVCTTLASVDFPDTLTIIDHSAFEDCTSLASVVFPAGLTTIGDNAFGFCSSLASVVLPAGLKSIGRFAFAGCTSLASVDLPGLTTLGEGAFSLDTFVRHVA
jgi:hypothetical protein